MMAPTRSVLRYYGGKWRLAPWIISHFPQHRMYTEVFAGAASVMIQKPRAYAEIYNDLDGEVVNVFRVLRDPSSAARLAELVALTPFAREDFEGAYEPATDDPVELARLTICKAFMGFGSSGIHDRTNQGMRTRATWHGKRSWATPATDWSSYPDQIPAFVERLRGVVIENRPALEVLAQYDKPDCLHYLDPPYPIATRTRSNGRGYRHELDDAGHRELAVVARSLDGMVVISGYPSDLYDLELYPDWQRLERAQMAQENRSRTEVLWISPRARKLQLQLGE